MRKILFFVALTVHAYHTEPPEDIVPSASLRFQTVYGKYDEPQAMAEVERILTSLNRPDSRESLDILKLAAGWYKARYYIKKAESLLLKGISVSQTLAPTDPDRTKFAYKLSRLYWETGRPARARPVLLQLLDQQEKALGKEAAGLEPILIELSSIEWGMGMIEEAEMRLIRGVRLKRSARSPSDSLKALGYFYAFFGKLDKAEQMFRENLAKAQLSGNTYRATQALEALTGFLYSHDKRREAAEVQERVIRQLEESHRPMQFEDRLLLAGTFHAAGQPEKADERYRKELRRLAGHDCSGCKTLMVRSAYMDSLLKQRKYNEAAKFARDDSERETVRLFMPTDDGKLAVPPQVREGTAEYYMERRRFAQAETIYHKYITLTTDLCGEDCEETVETILQRARLYAKQNQFPQAEEGFEKVLALRQKSLGPQSDSVGLTMNEFAKLLDQHGDKHRATEMRERATQILQRMNLTRPSN
jgi:tetratricopeptide (TPR) repeat protein